MEFHEYNHISNLNGEKVRHCREQVAPTETWVLTEKVHGCNVGLYTDGVAVKAARRNGFLGATDKFHGSEQVIVRYRDALLALWNEASKPLFLVVYGELYGGLYPHKDVKAVSSAKPVQKGVFYAPGLHFLAFDVAVSAFTSVKYLAWDHAHALCTKVGIPFTAALRQGSLDELLNFDVETFETTLPTTLHRLPPLPNNIAEGVVLRPLREHTLPNGVRTLLKIKSERFREVSHNVSQPAQENAAAAQVLGRPAADYVNENRLRTLLSKLPERVYAHRGHVFALVPLLLADVIEELEREHPMLTSLSTTDARALRQEVADAVKQLLGQHADAMISKAFFL